MVCAAEELRVMIGYHHFRPTSAEVRRERKRIAQRKYRNSLRLRSEVAQLNDTCKAREEDPGWRVDFDLEGCEGERSTLRDLFETEGLECADSSLGASDTTVRLQKGHDEADADWCCVGSGRDSLSPASTIDVRHGQLGRPRELYDCANGPTDSYAGGSRSGRSSISGSAQPPQSILFQISEGGDAAAENLPDGLQHADETLNFTHSGVDEMGCGRDVPRSSGLSHMSRCPSDVLVPMRSGGAGPRFVGRSRTMALQNTDFGLASPSQASTTTGSHACRGIRISRRKDSEWEGRLLVRDAVAEPEPPPPPPPPPLHSPNVQEDPMTAFPSITVSPGTDRPASQGVSPLFQAAMAGNVKILSIMVRNSVYPEMVDQHGQTILHVAARNGHCGEVEFLIGAGFDVNARDNLGNTALHLAISHGWEKMVEVLVDAGADVDGLNYK
ncbi:hypothetical protein E4U42_002262 [Claviceps africana]|uniref:Uncharacterized protein n=1 Tax=Claviceps africana TaxID=83212 RepID=A0A8K0J8X2_9HYPO|nr:hypothetical protein E4U42_002262 [Claviceps africana]